VPLISAWHQPQPNPRSTSIDEMEYWLLILRDVMTSEEMENHVEYL
jgi:hypothetical protein